MFKIKSKGAPLTTLLYLALLAIHVLHSYIERHEGASFIIGWYKNYYTYADLEIVAFTVAVAIFILYLMRLNWSYYLSTGYSAIMVIDGLYHVAATLKEGKSFGSSPGTIITSIGFILLGAALFQSLRNNKAEFL